MQAYDLGSLVQDFEEDLNPVTTTRSPMTSVEAIQYLVGAALGTHRRGWLMTGLTRLLPAGGHDHG